MKNISVFEKYKDYDKNVILLAIKTMTGQEKIWLNKGYGYDYNGNGFLHSSEVNAFERADKALEKRIKEVDLLIKQGNNEKKIIDNYIKNNSNSILSMYGSYTNIKSKSSVIVKPSLKTTSQPQVLSNFKLKETFVENFPLPSQKIIEKMLPKLSKNDEEIIRYFYWGKNLDILRKYEPNAAKEQQFNLLINKLKLDALKQLKEKKIQQKQPIKKVTSKQHTEIIDKPLNKVETNIKVKSSKSFLSYFDEKDHEKVLEIIKKFEKTNPNYYELINKKYSDERYEIVNDVELNSKEKNILNNLKIKIKNILKLSPDKFDEFLKQSSKKNNSFLSYFNEKDHEKVLKIIKRFEKTNPNYYELINKKYSGERYEIVNDVKLNNTEYNNLIWARKKIVTILKYTQEEYTNFLEQDNKRRNKVRDVEQNNNGIIQKSTKVSKTTNKIIMESINDILKLVPKNETDNIFLNTIIKNRKYISRIMNIDEVVDCYIENLSYFEEDDVVTIIKTIAIYQPDKITKLIESSYFKDKLQYLTSKEQEYIYLTLLSYTNKFLTPKRIAEILEVDKKTLEQYEVMTSNDKVNKLNILFKKSD